MPDDAAKEKSDEVAAYGAQVTRVRPVSIAHAGAFWRHIQPDLDVRSKVSALQCQISFEPCHDSVSDNLSIIVVRSPYKHSPADHMVQQARRRADAVGGFFADQFENVSNFHAHIGTAQEIWRQTRGAVDAFVCGAGTGGTLAGVSCELKKWRRKTRAYLADPDGSSLLLKVRRVSAVTSF